MPNSRYFEPPPPEAPLPDGTIRVVDVDHDLPSFEVIAGLDVAPLFGKGFSVNFTRWKPNTTADPHVHDEEQLLYVMQGELRMEMGGARYVLQENQALYIPSALPHQGSTGDQAAYQLDIFSPVRATMRQLLADRGIRLRIG